MQHQWLKYEQNSDTAMFSSDTTMFVCVRIFVEFVFQSHPLPAGANFMSGSSRIVSENHQKCRILTLPDDPYRFSNGESSPFR